MKPLNSQERTKQFFIFLAFYLVTTALVVGIVHFNYNVPKAAYKALKEENTNLADERKVNNRYLPDVDSLISKIKNLYNDKTDLTKNAALTAFSNLSDAIQKDTLTKGSIYISIIDLSKFTLLQYEGDQKNIKDLKQQLDEINKKFDEYKILHP